MTIKNWAKFIALSLIWGTSFFWIKIGLREAGPITLVFFRVGFATLGLIIFLLAMRKEFPLKNWKLYLFLAFFNVAFPFVLISWSEEHISSAVASIMNSTQPLATALFAAIFIAEERLILRRIIGLLVGFAGVLVLMSGQLSSGISVQVVGILAMALAVLSYGGSAVYARLHNQGINPESQALGQMSFALIFLVPAMLTIEAPFVLPVQPVSYVAYVWLGLLGSCFASVLWYSLLNEIGPSRVSMTTYLLPLIGVSMGALLLHESVDWRLLAGGFLIILGIIIVNSKTKPFNKPAKATLRKEG